MARFDDYHRTVISYHGTGLSTALRIINRIQDFRWSDKDYDWLGSGIYFWEYAPRQALAWADLRQRQYRKKKTKTPDDQRRATEPLAVIACMIRLGFCLDLTEPENVKYMSGVYESYKRSVTLAGDAFPTNDRHYRKLDRAVFNYAYELLVTSEQSVKVDTARGIYVPRDRTKRVWQGSWISRDTHIQLCVRNRSSILGTWLHLPNSLEVSNVQKALHNASVNIRRANSQGEEDAAENVPGRPD